MALTKVTGQVINTSTDVTVGVLTVTNNLSVGGTLTYEDVTNVDSVGLITARDGISITGGNVTLTGGGSFTGDGSGLTGIAATANVRTGILDVAGIATFRSNTLVGSGITLSPDGDVFAVGVSTFNGNVLVGSGITLSPDGDGFFTGITTTTSFNVGTGITFSSSSASFGGGLLQETFHNDTSAVSGTHNHDVLTYGMVWNGSTNAGGSFVINIRGDVNTKFDSLIGIGKVTTMTIYSANNSTSNYMSAFQIDGSAQTIKYSGGSAPSAATGSGVDLYSLTILKTAADTYSVFGSFTNFA